MKIIDLTEEHQDLYFNCLEDWSAEIKEAGNHKECWFHRMKDKGLRVKLGLDENEKIGGMIQYIPIEHSPADGKDLYFISCIWVHGYKQGRGNFQKKGMGKALIQAAENDAKELGAKGIVAWGIALPFWMKALWFKKQGYKKVEKYGFPGVVLLWKSFTDDAMPPKWIRLNKKPEKIPGKVIVTSFVNGWCPAQNMVYERAKKAVKEFGDKVVLNKIDTFNRETFLEWGISDALFIDDKQINTGPPPSYQKIKHKINRKIKRLKLV